MSSLCRLCLRILGDHDKNFYKINREVRENYTTLTGSELIVSNHLSNIVCEICMRSLQLASSLKTQFLENQRVYLGENEAITGMEPSFSIKMEPEFDMTVIDAKVYNNLIDDPLVYIPKHTDFDCDTCGKNFRTPKSLRMHKLYAHTQNGGPVVCTICGNEYKMKRGLDNHMAMKHSDPSTAFQCDICAEYIFNKQLLQYHMHCKHLKKKDFHCKTCDKSYFKKSDLNRHIRRTH